MLTVDYNTLEKLDHLLSKRINFKTSEHYETKETEI